MMTELERIARDLCQADGFDPDTKVHPHPMPVGVRGLLIASDVEPIPQWQYYEHYVKAVLDEILRIDLGGCTSLHERIASVLGGDLVADVNEQQMEEILPNWRQRMGLQIL